MGATLATPGHKSVLATPVAALPALLEGRLKTLAARAREARTRVATAETRLEAMDALRDVARDALVELDRHLAEARKPLSVPLRAALSAGRALASEMVAGYRGALEAWFQMAGKRPLGPIALNGLRFASAILRSSYLAYARVPEGAWRDLHIFYLAAESHGAATGIADGSTRQSVTGAYTAALLLAITDPYRMAPAELEATMRLLDSLRASATIGREPPATHATAHFLVPCDLDEGPRSARADDDPGGSNWRLLDANPVVEALRETLAELQAGQRMPLLVSGMDRDAARLLVAKLARLWDDPPRRIWRRETATGSVAICVGVKPIAHFVAHDARHDEEEVRAAVRDRLTMPLHTLPEDEAGNLIPIHEWDVVNLSAGGMKVRRAAATEHPIAVGEVVGIKTPGKPLWTIGSVRWINQLDDGTAEFGVQFFAQAACAVWLKSASPAEPPKLALLVTSDETAAAEAVLTPPAMYAAGAEFLLRGEGLRYRATATTLVERTPHFDLFRIEAS